MKKNLPANRRAFLRGAGGVLIALPFADFAFDSLSNQKIIAQEGGTVVPKLVTMYFPNGCDPNFWNFDLALQPLADLQSKIILFKNIHNPVSEAVNRDAHEQGAAALFTGVRLENDLKSTGISMDQWYSRRVDQSTTLKKPLVAGVWRGYAGGIFRSQSWFRRSWLENGDPVTPVVKPLDMFNIIFGDQSASIAEKKANYARQHSVLDSVLDQMKSLTSDNSKLPSSHKALLATHLDRVRDLEKRVATFENNIPVSCSPMGSQPAEVNFGNDGLLPYADFDKVYHLQMDLMALALQCEATHTGSLMFCCAGEEFIHPSISSSYTDHGTSHYPNQEQRDVFINYRRYHANNLKYFMNKLEEAKILDSTVIVYGSEFGDSRSHTINPQPHLIAGGGGQLKMGQTIDGQLKNTNCDIYSTTLTALGQKADTYGEAAFNTGHIAAMLK